MRYEVEQSALRGNGLLGIDISGLRNRRGGTGKPGESPFWRFELDEETGVTLDEYVPEFDWVLEDGYRNFRDWVRTAPTLRDLHRDFERDFGRRRIRLWAVAMDERERQRLREGV